MFWLYSDRVIMESEIQDNFLELNFQFCHLIVLIHFRNNLITAHICFGNLST